MRPDAERWIRPDVARFLAPGARPQDVFPALDRKYNPNQPRVPKGNPDGGQWTFGGLGSRWEIDLTGVGLAGIKPIVQSGRNDPRVISDADPEPVKPGQQYAQLRGRRVGNSVYINGQQFELSLGQSVSLTALEAQADMAIARVNRVDPTWKPPVSSIGSVEGMISAERGVIAAAEAKMAEFKEWGALPGRYVVESIPARGPGRNFNVWERREGNRMGYTYGCHTCGEREPGTASGNFCLDHQEPNGLNFDGRAQRLYPQCLSCSLRQGYYVQQLLLKRSQ
ncbi:MAG: hypothetical protein HZA66_13205 [Rhodopseudomonas palustris]|uniref:Uncharacterized protein n=1 Tax=Rhodopseudomonas palustris TaxID=1076 RepID=A0A933RZS6_RHOPL|nr:hypothetical protein [Rhodopseudomonas palustris]